jgi:manganese transport protein
VFKKILVALDNTTSDETLLGEISELARLFKADLLLVHVSDGWVARNYDLLKLAPSEEMEEDQRYLEKVAGLLEKQGLRTKSLLALGDPPNEILKVCSDEGCDMIAMTTHGHRLLADVLYGSTIDKVRHRAPVPLLVFPARKLNEGN